MKQCFDVDCDYSTPLGMISGDIQDWQLSASSTYPQEWDKNCHERYARLYQANGRGWCARYKTSSEWLQVDLGVAAKVSGDWFGYCFCFTQMMKNLHGKLCEYLKHVCDNTSLYVKQT